jgi:hypothetical protein
MGLWLVRHELEYGFESFRLACALDTLLRPRAMPGQVVHSADLVCAGAAIAAATDALGNERDRLTLTGPLRRLTISAESRVECLDLPDHTPPDKAELTAPPEAMRRPSSLWSWAAKFLPDHAPGPAAVARLTKGLARDFAYDPRATAVGTPIEALLSASRGACQDVARLAVASLQARGVPARYMLGYAPGASAEIALHAWFAAWFDGQGWLQFDSVLPPGPRIVLGFAPDQQGVPVVRGECSGPACRHVMASRITVTPA